LTAKENHNKCDALQLEIICEFVIRRLLASKWKQRIFTGAFLFRFNCFSNMILKQKWTNHEKFSSGEVLLQFICKNGYANSLIISSQLSNRYFPCLDTTIKVITV